MRSVISAFRCLAGLLLAGLAGCHVAPPADPALIRVSAIPDQAPDSVRRQHAALVDRVCALAKVACEWVPSASYEALVERFGRGEVDLAYFGAATFVQARHRHGAEPIAMRDIDFRFTSVLIVPLDHPATDVEALRGVRFAFGSKSSTSGHFMARHLLQQTGIVPERHFGAVQYTGDHDATLQAVARGDADAGILNATVYFQRLVARDAAALAVRVLWRTPPYSDYVWAARPQLSEPLRRRLTDAFLDLAHSHADDRPALDRQGALGYVPAFPEDFDAVKSVVASQGRL